MTNSYKISLLSLIFININIMIGAGVFINTSKLTEFAGSLSPAVYAIVGILLLPLVLSMIKLWQATKGQCTFYHFGLPISPFFGFLSSWTYFIGKLCSFALGIHVCILFLQQTVSILQLVPALTLDLLIILFFTIFNYFNLRTGRAIQITFLNLKLIPVFFAIFSGLYLFSSNYFVSEALIFNGIAPSIPLALFAFVGFEATCSLSHSIENPEKNGPRAILFSYIIVVCLIFLFQLMLYSSLGLPLGQFSNGYLGVFPALLNKLFINFANIKTTFQALINVGIASSSLGAAYGIMYSNSWNLYTLAKYKHTFVQKILTSLNKHGVPFACIIIESILAAVFLLITKGNQIPLQQVGALGSAVAYTFSIIAAFLVTYRTDRKIHLLPLLGLLSCSLLIASFAWSISASGLSVLFLLFLLILLFGSFMFYKKHEPHALDVYEHL